MRHRGLIACTALCLFVPAAASGETGQAHWPADAKVFFVAPKDGDAITGPVKVVMGVEGIEIAPAGTEKPATGHHHILIDTDLPKGDEAQAPLPANEHVKHFGKGQTEAELTLAPGTHTLQLVAGDGNHIPYDPALASQKITITVKAAASGETGQAHWPADAKVFFVAPKDGDAITGPVKAVMGVQGIEIAPAGTEKPNTGHHHILIDTDLPKGDEAQAPLPANEHVKHFGKGQTEAELTLAPGTHTLQLVVGDGNHIPYDPALASQKITITVK